MSMSGIAKCTREPRGDHGLEVYSLGCDYRFKRETSEETGNKLIHLHQKEATFGLVLPYMNTTTERRFMKYFRIVHEE